MSFPQSSLLLSDDDLCDAADFDLDFDEDYEFLSDEEFEIVIDESEYDLDVIGIIGDDFCMDDDLDGFGDTDSSEDMPEE